MGCSQVVRQWTLTPSSVGSNPSIPDKIYFIYSTMNTSLQLLNYTEKAILLYRNSNPIKSIKNLKTSKSNFFFIFIKPIFFTTFFYQIAFIKGIFLLWKNKKIINRNIKLFFKEGKPYLLKVILVFQKIDNDFIFFKFLIFSSKNNNLYFLKEKEL